MFFILISTLVRYEALGPFNKIISDEFERIYFPSSQITYKNALDFEITYKKAYFSFPIGENFAYSFYFDSVYGIGIGYSFRILDVGINLFNFEDKVGANIGTNFRFLENKDFKLSFEYLMNIASFRGLLILPAFEQMSFRVYGEYKNSFNGIFAVSYEPTIYRFLMIGISNVDTSFYVFSSTEFLIFRDLVFLRGGVWQNLKTDELFLTYGFAIAYNNLRVDFILNEQVFKIAIFYNFKVF